MPDLALNVGSLRLRPDDVLVGCIILVWLLGRRSNQPRSSTWPTLFAICGASFLAIGAISIVAGVIAGHELSLYWVALFVFGAGTYIALLTAVTNRSMLVALVSGISVGAAAFALQFYYRLYSQGGFARYVGLTRIYDIKEELAFSSWNPNTLGAAAITFLFAALAASHLCRAHRIRKIALLAVSALMVPIPILGLTRGAVVAMIFGVASVVIILWARKPWRLLAAIFVFGAVLGGVAVMSGDVLAVASKVNLSTGEGTAGRYELWRHAIDIASDNLMCGVGVGMEQTAFRWGVNKGSSHNSFLSVLVEMGLLGLVVFVAALGALLGAFVSALRKLNVDRPLVVVGLGLYLAICTSSLTRSLLPWQKMGVLGLALSVSLLMVAGINSASDDHAH